MIAMGVDPGIARTGYGIVKDLPDGSLLELCHGIIRTEPKVAYPVRLKVIHDQITSLIERYTPDVLVLEQVFFNKNTSTALSVGQSRGVVILTAALAGIEVSEYTPIQIKEAVSGYGHAEKAQVQRMVKVLLGLEEVPKPDDAADALALAICHLNSYRISNLTTKYK